MHIANQTPFAVQADIEQLRLSAEDLSAADAEARVQKAYKRQALVAHPDKKGGDTAAFLELQAARARVVERLAKRARQAAITADAAERERGRERARRELEERKEKINAEYAAKLAQLAEEQSKRMQAVDKLQRICSDPEHEAGQRPVGLALVGLDSVQA